MTEKQKRRIKKVNNRIVKRYGLDSAWKNLQLNLNAGTCTIGEYEFAASHLRSIEL